MAVDVHPRLPRIARIFLKSAEHLTPIAPQRSTAIAALSPIAQTASANGSNVRTTLCASNARKASDAAHG